MARTDIICMDTGEKLTHVTSVDAEAGVVWRACQPVRLSLKDPGRIDVYPTHFRSVYLIYAGSARPYLVHCYGRSA